jgi:hypothetical protein
MANPPSASKPTAGTRSTYHESPANEEQSVHVHEVTKDGAPPLILSFFEDGGESLHLDSENIITQNWILAQLAGAGGYTADNHAWIKELVGCKFHLQRISHKSGVSKMYMVFNGNNKLRQFISATKYGLQHTKVMRITGGAGGTKQVWDAAKGATKDSLKVFAKEEGKMVMKGGGIAVFFAVGMDVAEWYRDYSEIGPDGKHQKDFYDLFAKVGTDLAKAGLVAALTTVSVAAGFTALAAIGVTVAAPVVLVVVGTIVVSVVWTYFVEKNDRIVGRALGENDTTTWLVKKFREVAQFLSDANKDVRYKDYPVFPMIL